MYRVGYILERIGHKLPNFTHKKRYEIALVKQDESILLFDDSNNPAIFSKDYISEYFELVANEDKTQIQSLNNGGSTDYYKIKDDWKMAQDIIEDRKMNFSQGNIFKSSFTFNIGRHSATNYERELNKIKYFCDRELERIKREDLK